MINFRYHIVSLIAVFLALAIGVIMGSAVIDRAIVSRLEDQQRSLEGRLKTIEGDNDALRSESHRLHSMADQLSEQGSQRLLVDTLVGVPVLVIATRGVESKGYDDLIGMLGTSGAGLRGTLWLTERFELASDAQRRALAQALSVPSTTSGSALRTLALTELSMMLRAGAGPAPTGATSAPTITSTTASSPPTTAAGPNAADLFSALRNAGFVDFDAPKGQAIGTGPVLTSGTRLVLISGSTAKVAVDVLALPFAKLLATDRSDAPPVALLAVEDRPTPPPAEEFVVALRADRDVSDRLSTVDDLGELAGRLAAVLAIVDLGEGRVGQYGVGPRAQRLLPAPPKQ